MYAAFKGPMTRNYSNVTGISRVLRLFLVLHEIVLLHFGYPTKWNVLRIRNMINKLRCSLRHIHW